MDFPLLDSSVSVQYTAAKSRTVRHEAHRFLGDGRQSYRRSVGSGQSWLLRYEVLNADEANRLRTFYEAVANGTLFHFIDPWSGFSFPQCRIAERRFFLEALGPGIFRAELEVEDAV